MASIEEKYQQLQHREHIYKLPDTYIGSIEASTHECFVLDTDAEGNTRMIKTPLTIVPGFFKIFDEILVNALDHRQRDESVRNIKVDFALGLTELCVYNDGAGIDVCMHPTAGVYVPELLFGHLLTSSNYRDDEKRTTGGKNGYGATLVNIFSQRFTLETVDATRQLKYVQSFTDNGVTIHPPKITKCTTKSFTRVTFLPDYTKFGLPDGITPDIHRLFTRRVYDAAAIAPTVTVTLNGTRLKFKTLERYVELFTQGYKVFYAEQARWRVALVLSPTREFEQISFVNGIWTAKGGRHVDAVWAQVLDRLKAILARHPKTKTRTFKSSQLKDHVWLFVDSTIENPSFTSQTKEELTTKAAQFGSSVHLDEAWVEKWSRYVHPSGDSFMDRILETAQAELARTLKKTDGAKKHTLRGIPKLEDAVFAGTRRSRECTLILTEGDSAKASVLSGLSVLGSKFRDTFGVFPLRGKFINVRELSADRVANNEEVKALKVILGLQQGKVYTADTLGELRYGSVAFATDQDSDAAHIRGLLLNFFHVFWPSLLTLPGFLKSFITPIVKGFRADRPDTAPQLFYTLKDYEHFRVQHGQEKWTYKYYKGLGTSTAAEFKDYFRNLDAITRVYTCDTDAPLVMVFHKAQAQQRKEWLQVYDPNETLEYHNGNEIRLSDFVHKDLKHFSNYDNLRSIPNVVDGLKPSQRKVLHALFKRGRGEIKVAQLAAYVSEQTHYHHGEASLEQTIVGLAQSFVGKTNLPLLEAKGQFGTRLQGGADHAQSRYIFTELADVATLVFPEADTPLLSLLEDEGKTIEPAQFYPIVPMVLLSGAVGIGTGYSTHVPLFHPLQVCDALLARHTGEPFNPVWTPWYAGFQGRIESTDDPLRWTVYGAWLRSAPHTLMIKELPLGVWTQPYKEFLEAQIAQGAVLQYVDKSTDERVEFQVTLAEKLEAVDTETLVQMFKLTGRLSMNNMYLYEGNQLRLFRSVADIMDAYYAVRLDLYVRRKAFLLQQFVQQQEALGEKIRFIQLVLQQPDLVFRRTRKEIVDTLRRHEFRAVDTLLQLPLYTWTEEKLAELDRDRQRLRQTAVELERKSATQLWTDDLLALRRVLVQRFA
jgi:DNA topoisomerase-2